MSDGPRAISIVIPNWNGRNWLPGCLEAIVAQRLAPAEIIVVDNGSTDGSVEFLRTAHSEVEVIALDVNTGFARAANLGIEAAGSEFVALVNTDVLLAPDWTARMEAALREHADAAAVACKMLDMEDRSYVYDAGDVLRRDGACVQRGRFGRDDGRWDTPGEVFGACAGAAMYRRDPVLALGGFDERYFAYLEDVDLALRLQLIGWRCRYEPVVARHVGGGSAHALRGAHWFLVARNTLVLVAKFFPLRWLPLVAYRQLSWLWHAKRERRLITQLRGLGAAVPLLPAALRQRPRLRAESRVRIELVVPAQPIRGPRALGHRSQR